MIEIKFIFSEVDDKTAAIELALNPKQYPNVEMLNSKSRKFTEKRTSNSLLSKYAASTPFLLFYKEGVVVSALYNESVIDTDSYPDMIFNKYTEAINAIPKHDIDPDFD